jgi:restriction endonuclease S subunit
MNTELPKDWKLVKLGEICKLKNGFAFKSEEYEKEGIPVVRMGNINREYKVVFNKDKQPFISEKRTNKEFLDFIIKGDDLLITLTDLSTTGNFLGTVALFPKHNIGLLNQRVAKIILNEKLIERLFLYYGLQSPCFRNYMKSDKTGSLQKNTNTIYIEEYDLPIPPLREQ